MVIPLLANHDLTPMLNKHNGDMTLHHSSCKKDKADQVLVMGEQILLNCALVLKEKIH